METDNGNVWYDPATRSLSMMIATQSPFEVAERAAEMLSKSKFVAKKVDLKCGHTVGYGTKDHHVFPLFAVIAGLYGEGRPVRLANDRFEQFQMGLKRHAFWMKYALTRRSQDARSFAPCRASSSVTAVDARTIHDCRHGRRDRGAIHLLSAAKRLLGGHARLARRRGRLDARLRHAADDVGDRDAGRRGRAGTRQSMPSICV